MRSQIISTILITIAVPLLSIAQDVNTSALDAFSGKLVTNMRKQERQIAYLVTDKSVFTGGETIWFKATVINSVSQRVTNKVPYLFVDLVNEKDSLIKLVILDAGNQQLSGRIILPASIPEGYYWLRAYSRQMAENDPNSMFVKSIYVSSLTENNRFTTHREPNAGQDNTINASIYPEGGTMMTGINTTVAIRTTDKNGIPISVAGTVKDDQETVMTNFTTNSLGMAKFEFEPSRFRKYRAIVNYNGKESSFALPPFNLNAGQISVSNLAGILKLRILLEDSIIKKSPDTYIIGMAKDSLVFAGMGKGLCEVMVDKKRLPDGIVTFYLFDKSFNLLSERSVYIHDNDIRVTASTDKTIYGRRDKVTINISVTDKDQHPVQSLLTVAVVDSLAAASVNNSINSKPVNDVVISNQLLAGNALADEETDLLMMTRNNTYQSISKNVTPAAVNPSDSMFYIRGTVFTEKNEISPGSVVVLLSNSGSAVFYTDTANSKGRFSFATEAYPDSTLFSLQVKDSKGMSKTKKIVLDPINLPHVSTPVALKQYIHLQPGVAKKYYNAYKLPEDNSKTMAPVTVKGKQKVTYDESRRVSTNSTIITSEQIIRRNSVKYSVLTVPGFQILNGFLASNGPNSITGQGINTEPIVLVDGVKAILSITEPNETSPVLGYLNSLNPKEIDFIEVLHGPEAANYGLQGGNGVILVNTVNHLKDVNNDGGGGKMYYATGIAKTALFPIPDYNPKNVKNTTTTDDRSTIYWNGGMLSDVNNRAAVSFYTSDVPATYTVTITGITIRGDIIYKTFSFQSKK